MLRSAKKLPDQPLDLLRTFFKKYEQKKWKDIGDIGQAIIEMKNKNGDLKVENNMLKNQIRILRDGVPQSDDEAKAQS